VVIQYAPQLARWLGEDPDLTGAAILRRLRLCGYRGGKSAFYELVSQLRMPTAQSAPADRSPGRSHPEVRQRKAESFMSTLKREEIDGRA